MSADLIFLARLIVGGLVCLFCSVSVCFGQFDVDPGPLRTGRLAFSVVDGNAATIFVADFDRQKSYSVPADDQVFHDDPAWSRDGKNLLYSAGPSQTQRKIFIFGSEEGRPLTDGPDDENPQWFNGGDLVSFVRVSKSRPRAIWTMHADGSALEMAYGVKAESFDARPSPKMTELLVVTDTDWPGRDILLIPFDSAKPRLVTIGSVNHDDPAWNPDGQRFAVTAGRLPETDIAVIEIKRDASKGQSPLEYLTREAGAERNPEWHSDGQRLFYIKDLQGGNSEIRLLDSKTKEEKTIVHANEKIRKIAWTPVAALSAPEGKAFYVRKRAQKAAAEDADESQKP